jgi:hypothetical protein
MTLVDFVLILRDHLLNWQVDLPFREKKLIRVLVMLFDEIDLNGNGLMEWDEFTNYIIEKATVLNNIKNKADEFKMYTPIQIKINKKFNNLLFKVLYIADIDRLAVLEEESDEIYFVNHETGALQAKPLKVSPPVDPHNKVKTDQNGKPITRAEKSMVLDMIYINDKNNSYLLTSSHDGAIRTWRFSGSGFVLAHGEDEGLFFKEAQLKLAW